MRKLTKLIHKEVGRKGTPSSYREICSENSNTSSKYYNTCQFEFDIEKSNLKQMRHVVYANAEELVNAVVDKRNLIVFYQIKIMADGGQGFFKICFSILPESMMTFDEFCDSEKEEEPATKRKRLLYLKDDPQKAKVTSVKRVKRFAWFLK